MKTGNSEGNNNIDVRLLKVVVGMTRTRAKVLVYLYTHSDSYGYVSTTHHNISSCVGINRSVVSVQIRELINSGYVRMTTMPKTFQVKPLQLF